MVDRQNRKRGRPSKESLAREKMERQVELWKEAVADAMGKIDEEDSVLGDGSDDGDADDESERPESEQQHIMSKTKPQRVVKNPPSATMGEKSQEGLLTDQFSLLLTAIKGVTADANKKVERQLADFRSEIHRDHHEVTEKLAKRARKTKPIEFRRKGNEDQHNFNEELMESL